MASDWTVHRLEDCVSALIDYRGKTPQKASAGIPLITAKIVKGGRIDTPDEFIQVDEYERWMRRGIPKPGDVVVTTEAPLGEVAQLGPGRLALAQRLVALRGKPDLLDNRFLKFLMQSDDIQEQLRARASGTTVQGIKQSELRKVLFTLPPIGEQLAIAHEQIEAPQFRRLIHFRQHRARPLAGLLDPTTVGKRIRALKIHW